MQVFPKTSERTGMNIHGQKLKIYKSAKTWLIFPSSKCCLHKRQLVHVVELARTEGCNFVFVSFNSKPYDQTRLPKEQWMQDQAQVALIVFDDSQEKNSNFKFLINQSESPSFYYPEHTMVFYPPSTSIRLGPFTAQSVSRVGALHSFILNLKRTNRVHLAFHPRFQPTKDIESMFGTFKEPLNPFEKRNAISIQNKDEIICVLYHVDTSVHTDSFNYFMLSLVNYFRRWGKCSSVILCVDIFVVVPLEELLKSHSYFSASDAWNIQSSNKGWRQHVVKIGINHPVDSEDTSKATSFGLVHVELKRCSQHQ